MPKDFTQNELEKNAHTRLLCSSALFRNSTIKLLVDANLVRSLPADAALAWGRKPSAFRAEHAANKSGLPLLRIEDGFLRSFGTGDSFPSLSLVVDSQGIYYDSTRPSDLESMLASDENFQFDLPVADKATCILLDHQLSKYNHAPNVEDELLPFIGDKAFPKRVLVIDQTMGDMSVAYGAATQDTFNEMLEAAIDENPGAVVYVKTHPEVSSGRKRGYLSHVQVAQLPQGGQLVPVREAVNPISLLQRVSCVYVATSGMGFEALLCGRLVRCFGLPWYAGWGATQDELRSCRRTRHRTVRELFAAAYLRYSRYLNPLNHQSGSIFDVMSWLVRQRQMAGLA
jgi:capsular polysaccharide export protein